MQQDWPSDHSLRFSLCSLSDYPSKTHRKMASELKFNEKSSSNTSSSEVDLEKKRSLAEDFKGKGLNERRLEKEMGLVDDDGDGTTTRGLKQRHLSMIAWVCSLREMQQFAVRKGWLTLPLLTNFSPLSLLKSFVRIQKYINQKPVQLDSNRILLTQRPPSLCSNSLGGTIGTGLFVGLGSALSGAGPVSTLIGYMLMGAVVFFLMIALGEMSTLFPVNGGFVQFATRWIDPGCGFSCGWAYWFCYGITLPTEISASSLIIGYWDTNQVVPPAVWITILLILSIGVNIAGVRYFGEFEFWSVWRLHIIRRRGEWIWAGSVDFSLPSLSLLSDSRFALIKVWAIIVLIIVGIVLDLGGGPSGDRIGFRYWIDPGPMAQLFWTADPVTNQPMGGISGSLGRFLAFWQIFVNAAFSFAGTEIIGISLGEVENPRKSECCLCRRCVMRERDSSFSAKVTTRCRDASSRRADDQPFSPPSPLSTDVPKAIRRVFWRILLFYVLAIWVVGLIVPYNDPRLLTDTSDASASPFGESREEFKRKEVPLPDCPFSFSSVIAIDNAGIKVLPSIINGELNTGIWTSTSRT